MFPQSRQPGALKQQQSNKHHRNAPMVETGKNPFGKGETFITLSAVFRKDQRSQNGVESGANMRSSGTLKS